LSEKASQCSFARHFGTISPNVRTRKVVAPVAIAEENESDEKSENKKSE
jgi:hypothetical protein